MNKTNLVGVITQSYKNRNLIKGTNFTLTKNQTNLLVDFLKNNKYWNYEYLTNNPIIFDSNTIFDELNIFPLDFKNNRCHYALDFYNTSNFFQLENDFPDDVLLMSYISDDGTIQFAKWAFPLVHRRRIEGMLGQKNIDSQTIIDGQDLAILFGNVYSEYFKKNKTKVCLEYGFISDYIFSSEEKWFKLKGNIGYANLGWIMMKK